MKKTIFISLLFCGNLLLAQKTIPTVYGEKITFDQSLTGLVNTSAADLAASNTQVAALGKLSTQIEDASVYKGGLSGGGTLSVANNEVKWGSRFLVIGNGIGSHFSTSGVFNINMPANGTVITGANGAANVTVSANGIALGDWQALYFIITPNTDGAANDSNLRVINYSSGATFHVPWNWVKIVTKVGDDPKYFEWSNGIKLKNGTSSNGIATAANKTYATTEQDTGETWTDGKPIYRISYSSTTPSNTNDATYITITGATYIVNYEGLIYENTLNRYTDINTLDSGSMTLHGPVFQLYLTNVLHMFFATLPDARFVNAPFQVTVYYTK
jgi:hypothetical protein